MLLHHFNKTNKCWPNLFSILDTNCFCKLYKREMIFCKLSDTVRVWQLCFWKNPALQFRSGHEQDALHLDKP